MPGWAHDEKMDNTLDPVNRIVILQDTDGDRVFAKHKVLLAAIGGLMTVRVTTAPPLSDAIAAANAPDAVNTRNGNSTAFSVADPRDLLARLGLELAARDIALSAISTETAALEAFVTAIARRR